MDGGSVQYAPFNSSGLNYSSQSDTSSSLGSFSFVYPGERVAVAVYRYEIVNYGTDFESQGATWTTGDGSGDSGSIFAYDVDTGLDVETYGAALGFKANDSLSFGLGVNYYLLDISTTTDRFLADGTGINREANLDGDGGWGVTLGARWVMTDWLSAGLSYRNAPKLDYKAILTAPAFPGQSVIVDTELDVPDVFGIGFSVRPSEAWVINFDINRVFYSQLTDDITSVFDQDPITELDPLKLDDGTEIHLGAEYTFSTQYPFSLRAGIWRDPEHELRYHGAPVDVAINAATFSAGRGDQTHYAFGAGMVFSNFQVDLGADFSDIIDIVSLSGVYRF